MNAMQILSSQPWVERLGWTLVHFLWQGLSIAVLYAAARRGHGAHVEPERAIPARLRGTGSHDGRSARDLGADAAVGRKSGRRLSHPKHSPGRFRRRPTPPPHVARFRPRHGVRRAAGTVPAVGRDGLARRRGGVLGAAGGRLGGCRAHAVDAGPACAAGMAGDPEETRRADWSLSSRAVAGLRAGAGADGGRLAASGGAGAGGGARRSACRSIWRRCCCMSWRTSGGTIIWSTFCRASPKLCCSTTPRSGGCRGTFAPSANCAATMWPSRSAAMRSRMRARWRSWNRTARRISVPRLPPMVDLCPTASPGCWASRGRPSAPVWDRASSRSLFCWWPRHTDCSASPTRIPRFRRRRSNEILLTGVSPPITRWASAIDPAAGCAVTNASLMLLIQFAYAVHDSPHSLPLPASQVVGGPAWINSEGYDIEAKPEGNTDPKQHVADAANAPGRPVQADAPPGDERSPCLRFDGGEETASNCRPPKEAGCVSFPPGTPPRHVPGKVDCGYVAGPCSWSPLGCGMEGSKVHMADLIRELALILDRPVVDKTGFTGEFDLNLSFTPDEALMGLPGFGGPGDPARYQAPDRPQPPKHLRRTGGTARAEARAGQGPGRSSRHRSRGEAHRELAARGEEHGAGKAVTGTEIPLGACSVFSKLPARNFGAHRFSDSTGRIHTNRHPSNCDRVDRSTHHIKEARPVEKEQS